MSFVTVYSLKIGGSKFFEKNLGASFAVTCVTKSKMSIKSILLEHFRVLQICYKLLQNEIMSMFTSFFAVTKIFPTTKNGILTCFKKIYIPLFLDYKKS